MQVNIQINEETAAKLLYIQKQTDRDQAEILQIALAEYYNKLIRLEPKIDDWSDFIGSITAEPDLSKNHKAYLRTV
jgi:hypothetical protein